MNRAQSIVSAVVVLVVQVAAIAGHTLDFDATYQVIAAIAAIVTVCWALWKNHNLTDAANMAQGVLEAIKDDDDPLNKGNADINME